MKPIDAITIAGPGGARARVLTFGARLQSFETPDRNGALDSIVLGYPDPENYRRDSAFLGAVVGRYANRIAAGRFSLDGKVIELACNEGANHLHGGHHGFDRRDWRVARADERSVELELISAAGDQGYPGELTVSVRYAFDGGEDILSIDFEACSDAPTIVSLTHHAYFNLGGSAAGSIGPHWLQIDGRRFTPIDRSLIPTGEIRDAASSSLDFLAPHRIDERWEDDDEQLAFAGGYDHNFVIDGDTGALRRAARLFDLASGRTLDLLSSAPGLQFYSGNALSSVDCGFGGRNYRPRDGFCLEPQHFPDSPNRPNFPSPRLAAGVMYRHQIRLAPGVAANVCEAFQR